MAAIIGVPHLAMIRDAAEGRPLELVQGWTVEAVAESNAQFAHQHAKVTKAQALELLKANTARALELPGGLTNEQLQRDLSDRDQEALLPWCGPARTVEELVDNLLIGHIRLHRSSLKATVGR